jgi:heme a synthase
VSVTRAEDRPSKVDPLPTGRVGPWTRRIFWAGLITQTGIVVTGGLVRVTGSGLGCPTWPRCTDTSLAPVRDQAEGIHGLIEFGNRLLTFVVAVALIACVVAAWRHRPRRTPLVVLAALGFGGILAQAVLGGITVLTDLHPATVAAHFLLSMALIAAALALLVRGDETGDGPPRPRVRPEIRILMRVVIGLTFVVLVLGTIVTGSGPHSGDAEDPARFGFDPRSVSWLHADGVLLLIGLLAALVFALHLTGAPRDVRIRSWVLVGVVLAQGLVGYVQYLTGLPEVLVALHLLGACLVWIFTLRLAYAMRERSAV